MKSERRARRKRTRMWFAELVKYELILYLDRAENSARFYPIKKRLNKVPLEEAQDAPHPVGSTIIYENKYCLQ